MKVDIKNTDKKQPQLNAMQVIRAMSLLALVLTCLVLTVPAYAAEKLQATAAIKPVANPPGEAIAKGIIERGHRSGKESFSVLMPLTGTWDYLASLWTKPGEEPQQATGAVTNNLVMDGRYFSSKTLGSLNVGGQQMPLEGQEFIGYDNTSKSFSSVWVDSVTTGMMTGSGGFDEKKRVLNEKGRFTNPLTGVVEGFRSELQFVDTDNYKRTIFAIDKSGKESKLMEFDYSRRK